MCWLCDPVRPCDRAPFRSILVARQPSFARLLPDGRVIVPDEARWPGDHFPDLDWDGWTEVQPRPSVREIITWVTGAVDYDDLRDVVIDTCALISAHVFKSRDGKVVYVQLYPARGYRHSEFLVHPPAERFLVRCDIALHQELYVLLSANPWGTTVGNWRPPRRQAPVGMQVCRRMVSLLPSSRWGDKLAYEWQHRVHPDEEFVINSFVMPWLRERGFSAGVEVVARSTWLNRSVIRGLWIYPDTHDHDFPVRREEELIVRWPGRFRPLIEIVEEIS